MNLSPASSITDCVVLYCSANDATQAWCLGAADTQTVSLLNPNPNSLGNGLRLIYGGGNYCGSTPRTTIIILMCNPSGTVNIRLNI